MNERDFELVFRAKRQVQLAGVLRSCLMFGVFFCAAL